MIKTILKKALLLVGTLFLVTALAFIAFSVIPGDPTDTILGLNATEEQVTALREELGLNLPLWKRYILWIVDFVKGDFGVSYNFDMPVAELLADRMIPTLTLAGMSFVLILFIAFPIGILSAQYKGKWPDKLLVVCNQINMSVPNFIMGIGIVFFFGYVLNLFQPGGYQSPEIGVGNYILYMLFPSLAIAIPKSAMTAKMLRTSILNEESADYLRTAYSKGNTRFSAMWNHVLRNAMIPVVSFLTTTIAELIAGSIVIEKVFSIPGMGQMLVSSISNRDYPVVQAIIVLMALVIVLCNFLADILYRVIDPRLKER